MTQIVKNPPKGAVLAGPQVVVIAYDQLCTFEFGIAAEVFGLPRPEMGPSWFRYAVAGVDSGPMRAAGGLSISTNGDLNLLESADIIIVPGWRGVDEEVPAALVAMILAAWERGATLVSICSGVFVLAATGLLNDRSATTHWRYVDELQRRYPRIQVAPSTLYVDQGRILTSAGSAAGIDLCLHLVRRYFGLEASNSVAQRLVVAAHREGGQEQLIERPVAPEHEQGRISKLLDRMRSNLAEDYTVPSMAHLARMSERTFRRRFEEATGLPPAQWLLWERLRRSQELLVSTSMSVEAIAVHVGFGASGALRHHFRQQLGKTPSHYRQDARLSEDAA
ncbi:MAG TPA: transcriptional regulator FtrA [Pseudorhizobium sp.]|nr:transcriptional regulator FtrA [Pseudorhizobium sp.]